MDVGKVEEASAGGMEGASKADDKGRIEGIVLQLAGNMPLGLLVATLRHRSLNFNDGIIFISAWLLHRFRRRFTSFKMSPESGPSSKFPQTTTTTVLPQAQVNIDMVWNILISSCATTSAEESLLFKLDFVVKVWVHSEHSNLAGSFLLL